MMFFAIYQHESATGIHVCPPSWTPLPTLSLWVVPEQQLHNKPVFNMNLPLKTNKRLIHHFALEIIQCQNWKVPSNPTTHLLLESSLISFLGHCTMLTTSRDRVGRGVQEGGHTCIPVADSCWYMAKKHHNIAKQLFSN